MIIFHEGLPRSGKSYAAMVDHICRCLKEGRKVFAHVNGLNHEKIAEVTELPVEEVRRLLVEVTAEQVPEIHKIVENDSFVVIDELQDYFPNGRQKLSPEMTKFVTQHGHRGLDILAMGQALGDCSALWRRRVENKIVFMKLSAFGAENKYSWKLYKQKTPDKWEETGSGIESYDKKYFGTYKSHEDSTLNKGNYKDGRAVVWNSRLFKFSIPAVLGIGALALWFVVHLFSSGDIGLVKNKPKSPEAKPIKIEETTYKVMPDGTKQLVSKTGDQPETQKKRERPGVIPAGHIDKLLASYRARLGAVILSAKPRVIIEWRDSGGRIVESLESSDIEALGWRVMLTTSGSMVVLTDGYSAEAVTAWPLLDGVGTVPEVTNERIRSGG